MTATVLLSGVFLFATAAVVVLVLCAPSIWRTLTEEPPVDVKREVDEGSHQSIVRGMS